MALVASDTLFLLSGRQYPGSCLDIVRPCGECGCISASSCSCIAPYSLELRPTPVTQIVSVKIDGDTLDDSAYKLLDFHTLVRTDGYSWPKWQRLDRDVTQAETFEVQYAYGVAPPPAGKLAAAVLTCELIQARSDDGVCRIPDTARRITKQGISYEQVDIAELQAGLSGLREVDLFLRSVNPHGVSMGAAIASPDVGAYARRETWEAAP